MSNGNEGRVYSLLIYLCLAVGGLVFVSIPVLLMVMLFWLAGAAMRVSMPGALAASLLICFVWFMLSDFLEKCYLNKISSKIPREATSFVLSSIILAAGMFAIFKNPILSIILSLASHLVYLIAEPLVEKMEGSLGRQ